MSRHIHAMTASDLVKKFLAPVKYEVGWAPCLDACENSSVFQTLASNHTNAALRLHFIRDINNTVENV